MVDSKWDNRFMELARHVSTWSKDPSTQVGAVVVDPLRRVIGMGYNGFPRGVDDSEERYDNRELKYKMVVHAEVNAILNAHVPVVGSTLYVYPQFVGNSPPTCNECAKVIIQAGIAEVVGQTVGIRDDSGWTEGIQIAHQMYNEAGVKCRWINPLTHS